MSDVVDHPAHYNSHPSGVEAIAVCEHHNFNVGNAIKYLWRAGLKTASPVEDLKKAAWYVARELWRVTGEPTMREKYDAFVADAAKVEARLEGEIADYERTVAALRDQLRAEEARRASYQKVDGAARRFVVAFRRENPIAGWKDGWRCPMTEMYALLEAAPAPEPPDGFG